MIRAESRCITSLRSCTLTSTGLSFRPSTIKRWDQTFCKPRKCSVARIRAPMLAQVVCRILKVLLPVWPQTHRQRCVISNSWHLSTSWSRIKIRVATWQSSDQTRFCHHGKLVRVPIISSFRSQSMSAISEKVVPSRALHLVESRLRERGSLSCCLQSRCHRRDRLENSQTSQMWARARRSRTGKRDKI